MKSLDLIAAARASLTYSKGKPSQAILRRAVSTAYYAVFHCLARDCADLVVGGHGSTRSTKAWIQVYRALEHGYAKNQCKDNKIKSFPAEIENFAAAFATLQELRHEADYNPMGLFYKSDVDAHIYNAENSIKTYITAPRADRRAFCAWVLLKKARS